VSSIAARRRREEHDPSTRPGNAAATRCKDAPNTRLLMNTLVLHHHACAVHFFEKHRATQTQR
jgi:hypothetical protein